MNDADDAQRPRYLLAGQLPGHSLAVPAFRHLSECALHLVGEMQAPREQPAAFAEIRGRTLEPLLAQDQHLRDQARPFGQRPVVREPGDEMPHVLAWLGRRTVTLAPRWKWISSPPTQLAKYGAAAVQPTWSNRPT